MLWLLSVDFVDVETPTLFRRTPGVSNIFMFIMGILMGATQCFDDVVWKIACKRSMHQFPSLNGRTVIIIIIIIIINK